MALAGLFSALRAIGGSLRTRSCCSSVQASGDGIAELVVSAMMAEGLTEAEALRRNWLVDLRGLVVKNRTASPNTSSASRMIKGRSATSRRRSQRLKPTAIIGVAAAGGAFTPEVLQTMARINKRPIVFALSNPTSKAECSAEQAYFHTEGRALFACGSPYDP